MSFEDSQHRELSNLGTVLGVLEGTVSLDEVTHDATKDGALRIGLQIKLATANARYLASQATLLEYDLDDASGF
jgi:hypothetical protein